jgi:peptide deformylase
MTESIMDKGAEGVQSESGGHLQLVKYPDVDLRIISQGVTFPLEDSNKRLIKFMVKAMYNNHGVGLAAVQVGYHRRIFVMDCTRSQNNPKVFINPDIVERSDETLIDYEGCLSAPGKQAEVKRHLRIVLKYQDDKGEEQRKTFYNLSARCIQHEIDHLNGKLCIDYDKKSNNSRNQDNPEAMVESDFRIKSDS